MLIVIQSFVRLFEGLIFPTDCKTIDHDDEPDTYDIASRRRLR